MPTPSNPLKAVRGTRDLLPPDTALWNRVESIARSVFSRYGFGSNSAFKCTPLPATLIARLQSV
jgi:histidyl-tRNA synthetase